MMGLILVWITLARRCCCDFTFSEPRGLAWPEPLILFMFHACVWPWHGLRFNFYSKVDVDVEYRHEHQYEHATLSTEETTLLHCRYVMLCITHNKSQSSSFNSDQNSSVSVPLLLNWIPNRKLLTQTSPSSSLKSMCEYRCCPCVD